MNLANELTACKIERKAFAKRLKIAEIQLIRLQREIASKKIPVFILLDGLSTSGKSSCISHLVQAFDPRFYKVASGKKLSRQISWLQPFWDSEPAKGNITFFDSSWYRTPFLKEVEKKGKGRKYFEEALEFEKKHLLNGALVIKIFLNISESVQKKRLEELKSNKDLSWRVDKHDFDQNKEFDKYQAAASEMLNRSNFHQSPWKVLPADKPDYAFIEASEYLVEVMTEFTQNRKKVMSFIPNLGFRKIPSRGKLKGLDISKSNYEKQLPILQKRIQELSYKMFMQKKSAILMFEGWDAAGKGGAIRRLMRFVDPRNCRVCPIAAPSDIDKKHHYLWRFWTEFPEKGNMLIFDRTWYGRVLVERVEGFCNDEEWQRAYDEIVLTEKHLVEEGVIIQKFWLDIDKDIQKERFERRMNTPHKTWKITDEDWRNREKWEDYDQAVDEMILKTSHPGAEWTIVEGNNKLYARIQVIKKVIEALEGALE